MRVLSLADPMLTHSRRRARLFVRFVPVLLGTILAASACDKVPLLAPTGTVITLFPAASTVPVNGNVEIVATVIENGTASSAPSTGTGGTGGTTPTTPAATTTTTTTGA